MPARREGYQKGLHRFAVLLACCTFILVIAGGMVTSTDSGLAVPDWPLSYGQLMPPMVGGIFYEHGHRIVATLVGFLTTVFAAWLWLREPRRWMRILGVAAFVAVCLQGLLGGLTVLYLLPLSVSVSHATLAQSFFSLTVFLALSTSRWWGEGQRGIAEGDSRMRIMSLLVAGSVFVQLILGALMRHTNSGLAVVDFPLAYGTLWPSLGREGLGRINDVRLTLDLLPVSGAQVLVHMAHRAWAIIVACMVVLFVSRSYRWQGRVPRESFLILLLLLVFQLLLGALTIWTGRHVAVSTAHLAVGALVLASSVALSAMVHRVSHRQTSEQPVASQLAARGGRA